LTNPSKPYSPGAKSQKVDAITSLSWNNQVQHILATSSNTGYTVVWDLRNRREVVALAHAGNVMPASRGGISSIAWSPDVATQIVTASEDDSNPVIALWDLRNAHAPVKTLTGHQQGVLSLSWCQKDSDLLLSAGKDSRTLCWNPRSGEVIGELPVSHNWTFEVEWYNRNPEFFASASFDGKISIHSLQGSSREQSTSSFEQEAVSNDPFAPAAFAPQQSDGLNLKHPPKWLRRPVGATFAYGGKLTTFNNAAALKNANADPQAAATTPRNVSHAVKIRNISLDKDLTERVAQLQLAIENNALAEYAQQHISDESWTILQALMKENVREHLVRDLGFDKEEVIAQISQAVANLKVAGGAEEESKLEPDVANIQETPATASEEPVVTAAEPETTVESGESQEAKQEESHDEMTGLFASSSGADVDFLVGAATQSVTEKPQQPVEEEETQQQQQTLVTKPFKIYPEGSTDVDSLITRSLVLGDFESAVNMCLTVDRWADALMFAVCGGEDLLNRTRKIYFERQIEKTPYLRLVQGVINHDLQDIVINASLDDWREVMVILCTFAKAEEFESLCETLGERLEKHSPEHIQNAQLCYLAAGKLHKVVGIWIADQEADQSKPAALSLHDLMEKVTVYRNAINFVDTDMDAQVGQSFKLSALYDKYCDYARLLATEGNLTAALYFIDLIPQAYRSEKEDVLSVTRDRLHHADGNANRSGPVPFPFDTLAIAEYKSQQQPVQQQQQQQQPSYGSAYAPVQQQQQQTHRYDKPLPSATSGQNAYQGYAPQQPVQQQSPYARQPQPVTSAVPPSPAGVQSQQQQQPYKPVTTGYMPPQPNHSHAPSYGSQGSYGAPYNPYQAAPTSQAPLPPPPSNNESVAAYRKDIPAWNDPPMVSRTPGGTIKSPGTPTSAPQRITSPFPNAGPMPTMGAPMSNGPPPSHQQHAPLPPPPTGGVAPMPLYRSASPATGYRPTSPSMTQRGPYAGGPPPMHHGQQQQQQQQQQHHGPPPPQQQGRGSFSYAPPAGQVNAPGPMAPPPSHVQQQPVLQQPTAPAPAPAPAPAQPKRHRK
jgi:protein transport protein SEC31